MIKTVEKPWGKEEWLFLTDRLCMKKLYLNKGHRISLQLHSEKEEGSYIVYGKLLLTIKNDITEKNAGEWWYCPPKTVHRIEALEDTLVIEVSTPEVDDVLRIMDDYKRQRSLNSAV